MSKTPKSSFSPQNSHFRFKFFFDQNLHFVLGCLGRKESAEDSTLDQSAPRNEKFLNGRHRRVETSPVVSEQPPVMKAYAGSNETDSSTAGPRRVRFDSKAGSTDSLLSDHPLMQRRISEDVSPAPYMMSTFDKLQHDRRGDMSNTAVSTRSWTTPQSDSSCTAARRFKFATHEIPTKSSSSAKKFPHHDVTTPIGSQLPVKSSSSASMRSSGGLSNASSRSDGQKFSSHEIPRQNSSASLPSRLPHKQRGLAQMATAKLSQRTLSPLSTSRDNNILTSTGPKENQENQSKETCAKNVSHNVGG